MSTFLTTVDMFAVAVFAVSGAMKASEKQMDLLGFALLASFTGVGGGTLRDVLLDRPVFWIAEPFAVWVCLAVAVVAFFTAHRLSRRRRLLLWTDAVGVALYGVMGAEIASAEGAGPLVACVMGMMTATFGGLIRDLAAREAPLILHREVYATAAALAAAVHVTLMAVGANVRLAAAAGFASGFLLRAAGLSWGLSLPRGRARRS